MSASTDDARIPERLYTWVDVEEHLTTLAVEERWPEWLIEADSFWDGLQLRVKPGTQPEQAAAWLEESFGIFSVVREPLRIVLDDVPSNTASERTLNVVVEPAGDVTDVRRVPRWRERRIVSDLARPLPRPDVDTLPGNVQMAALHSFKGGVGRTLQALALTDALTKSPSGTRVLLVDADLEAPGITWMLQAHGRSIDFAYEDFLALLHGSADGTAAEAISLGAAFLPNQMLGAIIVMPATRRALTPSPPSIVPTDLLTPGRSPYFLTESLAALGSALGAGVVVIDLRAGTSELSAPVLLDPRVQRIFVSTLSDQSLRGAERLLQELARRAPSARDSDPPCAAVVTMVRQPDDRGRVAAAAARLRDALAATAPKASNEDDGLVDTDVIAEPLLSDFHSELLALPARWDDVLDLVRKAGMPAMFRGMADGLCPPTEVEPATDSTDPDGAGLIERRSALARTANRLVFAEETQVQEFLPTDSLRDLLASHRTEPPIAVLVGAKGAGKTFTFLQMCWRRTWLAFAQAAEVSDVTVRARVVPSLTSRNLADEAASRLHELREEAARGLGGEPATQLDIRDVITSSLGRESMTDSDWRRAWLTVLARSAGIVTDPQHVESRLAEHAHSAKLIFLVDGLEDLFQDLPERPLQQQALRVLLTDCLEWLRGLRGRPFGLLVFARRDLVQSAIRQNVEQFLARYASSELRWNSDEALRLALWACCLSGAVPDLAAAGVARLRPEDLATRLRTVWGDKMGGPKSREARSDRWFLAALSDFNQQIQARDVVSFLKEAAERSNGWPDRLLAPAAMREALPNCSRAKIEAISNENPPVGALLTRLRSQPFERRIIPFPADAVGLNPSEVQLLQANGVIFPEEDQYWIPEIFRHGLGFRAVGRPRILAIANLVRRRNNLD